MSIKLYVGNLPMQMTEAELKDHFAEAGNVASAKIITDRQTGQPRGFGFVEMADDTAASHAIAAIRCFFIIHTSCLYGYASHRS